MVWPVSFRFGVPLMLRLPQDAAAAGMVVSRIDIPGLAFPVTEFFLEDVVKLTGYTPEMMARDKQERIANPVCRI